MRVTHHGRVDGIRMPDIENGFKFSRRPGKVFNCLEGGRRHLQILAASLPSGILSAYAH